MKLSFDTASAMKALAFVAALVPLAVLAAGVTLYPHWLGANPAEHITRTTGDWTLRFLLLTLAVTPLRKLTGWHALARFRRMLGLYAFFYGTVHLSSYLAFDHAFDLLEIGRDILKRPFITVAEAFRGLVVKHHIQGPLVRQTGQRIRQGARKSPFKRQRASEDR